jgi:hypothetical protein
MTRTKLFDPSRTTAAAWGNEVSNTLYGYDKFTEPHYWPMSSSNDFTATTAASSRPTPKATGAKRLAWTYRASIATSRTFAAIRRGVARRVEQTPKL